jgi:arabinofuranan 3-O-arabinosyltransferase
MTTSDAETQPALSRTRLSQASRSRKVMWGLLAVGLIAFPFLSLPGKYVFDTRDTLWLNPGSYLSKALVLWRSSPYLGHEQHDGIAVPMGVVVWLLRSIGLAAWAAERVWHGLLIFVSAATTILLVDRLRGRRTILAPLAAGLIYGLTPYTFGYGLPFTGVYLPYVLLPLLLLITLRGVEEKGLLWPALFGLTMFAMGGGNGAPQAYVLLSAAALIAWAVFAEHTSSFGAAVRFGLCSLLFMIGLNAYWLFLLGSKEVSNALTFSEQPSIINVSSSASEAIRGLGFWQFYGGDQFGPWLPTVRNYITSMPLILTGFAIPVSALLSAWLVRWRYRLFFVFLAIVSVIVAGGLFPVASSTPFGRALVWAYDHVPGAAGLRTTYKVTAQLNLALAVLVAFGLDALWRRLRSVPRVVLWRSVVLATLFVVVAANAYPLWTGRLYNPARGVAGIPSYWKQAVAFLDKRDQESRAFFAPATSWATYRWGAIKEGITATDWNLSSVTPIRLPVGERYGSNLLAAIEEPYLDGLPAPGTAALLRYLGVRYVVLQNDLDWQRSHTARPAELQSLLNDPDLQTFTSFGRPGQNVVDPAAPQDALSSMERELPPVSILSVINPVRVVRAEGPDPIVISGDGFGLASVARAGLLAGRPPLLYSGQLTPQALQAVLDGTHPSFVVTDSNRRRVWYFTGPRSPRSYTLPAGQTLAGRDTGYLLFGSAADTQSVAVYPHLRSITASGYGSQFGADPQFRPANAFDGDPATWWVVGIGGQPAGSWIQAVLDQPRTLSSIQVNVPTAQWIRAIARVRLEFSDGSTVDSTLHRGTNNISFSERRTSLLRLRIEQATPSPGEGQPGAAIGDIVIPGLDTAEVIQVPNDLFDDARAISLGLERIASLPLTYLFERSRSGIPGEVDEETRIARRFEVPAQATYSLSVRAHLNPLAPDDVIDNVLFGPEPVRVTSSSRFLNNPALRGSAAFDGDPRTEWVPAGSVGESVSIQFPGRQVSFIEIDTGTGSDRTRVLQASATFSDGSTVTGTVHDADSGRIFLAFPPKATSIVTVRIDRVLSIGGGPEQPVSIKEIHIAGVDPVTVNPGARLPCVVGPDYSIDGTFVPVRPRGTVGDLLGGEQLVVGPCDGSTVSLDAGWHDIVARGGLQPDSLTLSTGGSTVVAGAPYRLPSISYESLRAGGFDVAVGDAATPYYLVIGQNHDPGWRASIGGRDLGPPMLLDGYSTGWWISQPGSYIVQIRFEPQRRYLLAVLVTGATLVAALAVVAVNLRRRRRGGKSPIRGGEP